MLGFVELLTAAIVVGALVGGLGVKILARILERPAAPPSPPDGACLERFIADARCGRGPSARRPGCWS
jgi:hypothetical protein